MINIEMTEQEYHEHRGNYDGLCLACGEIKDGNVEPDAENYECDNCGEHQVIGIEFALLGGNITIID